MTSRDFVYWLQGFFEISGSNELTEHQVDLIRRHLNMVFIHEIDPSMGPPEHQEKLNEAHSDPNIRIVPTSSMQKPIKVTSTLQEKIDPKVVQVALGTEQNHKPSLGVRVIETPYVEASPVDYKKAMEIIETFQKTGDAVFGMESSQPCAEVRKDAREALDATQKSTLVDSRKNVNPKLVKTPFKWELVAISSTGVVAKSNMLGVTFQGKSYEDLNEKILAYETMLKTYYNASTSEELKKKMNL